MKAIKCTIVGDPGVGKSALLKTFINGEFPEICEAIIFDTFLTTSTVDGKDYQLSLWYTNGMEEFNKFRPLSYPGTNIVLICFSLESRSSFENVPRKWYPEIKEHCPGTPILLVGLKQDLRHNSSNRQTAQTIQTQPVTTEETKNRITTSQNLIKTIEGDQMAATIGAIKYIEVSSSTKYNLSNLFDEAARHAAPTPKINVDDDFKMKKSFNKCKGCSIA